jgi:2-polyprenyl-3-methyl-5-hydroxy-6-metoxy-1,4-benzoquinol methylase
LADGPGTSDEVAARAGLVERYVRECLSALAAGGVVGFDADSGAFSLSPEAAVCLSGESSWNLAPKSQVLAMLSRNIDAVAECFRSGGGVPYEAFRPEFTDAIDASSRLLFEGVLVGLFAKVPGLTQRLREGIRVADVGCGTGHASHVLAQEYPSSTFVGFDIDDAAVARGNAEARELGLGNASFVALDATALPPDPTFDVVFSFDAIHDQRDPAGVLRAIAAATADDGCYLMVEPKAASALSDNIGAVMAGYTYGYSVLHCMTVSLAEDGAGLGAMWGEELARTMLGDAGFSRVETMAAPANQMMFVCRK